MSTKIQTKEHPIIFNSEMVRAILEGRKTQTRRVIRPQPPQGHTVAVCAYSRSGWAFSELMPNGMSGGCLCTAGEVRAPYGFVGDKLWVKEKHSLGGNGVFFPDSCDGTVHIAWQSARFMKKIFARIWLEITNIRVERVQDISEQDAEAEGTSKMHLDNLGQTSRTYKRGFESLWDSINNKRGFSWDSNPFVWVIEFKVLEK